MTELHAAVKRGDLAAMAALLKQSPTLVNARSEADPRGPYALHVAAEAGQTQAAKLLLDYGADLSLHDVENDSIALCWAAPLGCALGGTRGQWQRFSNATLDDWGKCAEIIRAHGGVE